MAGWRRYLTFLLPLSLFSFSFGFSLPPFSSLDRTVQTIGDTNQTASSVGGSRPILGLDDHLAQLIGYNPISQRELELDYYQTLWRHADVGAKTNSSSKTEVLGALLKKHVHKLRTVPGNKVELVFLVDSSASVGRDNFFNEIKFVKKLLADFTVAHWAARVAIITFSSSHRVHAVVDQLRNPSTEQHKCSLLNDDLPTITYVGGGTYTKGAFLEAQSVLKFARANATKAVFLITDGYSNGGDPRHIAKSLQRDGVEIFTFGIKNGNVQELLDMSSEPLIEHCYILSSFEEFESLARRALHEDLEEGAYVTEEPSKCRSLCIDGTNCCHEDALCRCGTHTGQYECICPAGHYGTGVGYDCKPCPMGTYKPERKPGGIRTCQPCPDQYQKSLPGSDDIGDCYCEEGFRSANGNTRCEQIRCPGLLRPEHGQFFSDSCDNSVNSACAIACDQGYEPVGDIIRLCTESGEWTGTDFQCVAKMCDPFPNLANGFVNCTNNQFVSGTICTSRCEPGYSLVGTRDRKCLPIAQWDGLSASCIPVKCEALDPIAHARVLPRRCTEGMVPYKTECKTVCYKGYTRIGARKIRCGADRQWTIQDGVLRSKCIDITLPNVTCPADIEVDVLPNRNYATVSWDEPIASDSTGLLPNLKVFPSVSPPWNFPIGENTVKYLATDRAGNSMSCSFTITICDNEPPLVTSCRSPNTTYNDIPDLQPLTAVQWVTPIFSDNSGQPVNVSYTHRSGEMMPLGSTTVEYIASDAFGNVKRCIIQVTVQRRVCEAPRRPTFGARECVRYLNVGLNCTLRCNTGYAFSVDTPTNYICYPNGSWSPHPVQHRECEVTYHTNRATQRIRLFYKLHNCSVDLVNDLEQSLATTLYDRIVGYCGDAMTCNVSTVSSLCNKHGALQNYLNSRLASEERPNERNRDIQGQRGVELTSDIFSALQGPVLEVLVSINASIGNDLEDPHGEKLETLLQTLRQIPERLQEEANNGRIDLNPRGANNSQLLVLPEQTNPVCGEGSVLHETGECVPCSKGAYFDERTKQCIDCPKGMYQSLPGGLSCDLCPSGTSTRRRGSESNEDCQDLCTPGSFSSSGVEQCESCALGSYQPSFGARECIPCPNNTTTVSIGSTQSDECAAPCQPGTISSTGVEPCVPCPAGSYQPSRGGMLCHPCPNNGMTQFSGSESVESCNVNPSFSVRTSKFSELTDIYFSFCLSHTCVNGASCHDALGGFSCTCQPGYTGVYCEIDIDDCEPSPCLNGTCIDLVGDFLCECDVGFQGLLCEENIDDCFPNPCHQNGVCLDAVADFLCECPVGFEGKQCEMDVNECESSPCMNNGSCINRVDGFSCSCHSNFTGDICSIEVKECFMNSTTPGCSDFFRNSSCNNLQQDFAGSLCKGRYDYCISSPCLNNGTCLNGISGFTCLCQSGISGSVCDTELSSNFSLIWRHQSVIDYSILKGRETFNDLYEVTVAFWMRTLDKSSYGTPFSYATSKDNDNALTLTDYNGFVPNINNEAIVTDVTCNDGLWHHLALTWTAERGDWSLYKDGLREANGTGVSPGKPIPGGGVLVLGQEQDEPGGEFHPVESFIGEMALLYLWDRAMTDEHIYRIARSCDSPESAVIRWPAFLSGRNGNVAKRGLHFCEGCGELEPLDLGNITNYQPGVPLNLVTFTCDVGFHVSGQETAECQVSGDWLQDENVQCRRNLCSPPGDVSHGRTRFSSYFYQSVIEYSCWDNYALIGAPTRVCQANGHWSGIAPVCIQSRCGSVARILHGEVIHIEGITPVGTVEFRCHRGYHLLGNASVLCGTDGSWGQMPSCNQVSCHIPLHDSPLVLTFTNGTMMADVREYGCDEGYTIQGNEMIACGEDGYWSGPVPSCNPVPCQDFPVIENMVHQPDSVSFGMMIHLLCTEGYYIEGAEALTCGSDGAWDEPLPSCTPVSCGPVPKVSNATTTTSPSQNFSFGEDFSFVCHEGFSLNGEGTVRCISNGTWYPSPPTCEPVSCGRPQAVPRAESTFTGTEYKNRATIICQEGYNVQGPSVLECSANREWVPFAGYDETDTPVCNPVSCGQPPIVENSILQELKIYTYLEQFTYQCQEGFSLKGDDVLSCSSAGTWHPVPPSCQRISCGDILVVSFAMAEGDGTLFGDIVKYTCLGGYQLQGGDTLMCSSSGVWYPPEVGLSPNCIPVSCGSPPVIENSQAASEVFSYNQTFSYKCLYGYVMDGNALIQCGSTGNWSAELPECTPVSCGLPHEVPNSKVFVTGTNLHSTANYTCQRGHRLSGQRTVSCLEDGSWHPAPPECNPVSCGTPDLNPHLNYDGLHFTYMEIVTYHCAVGFTLEGPANSQCLATGLWSNLPPTCSPLSCGSPPTINKGLVMTTGILFGDSANYSCVEGYQLNGTNPLICSSISYWAPSPPSCFPVSCGELPNVVNAHNPSGKYRFGDTVSYNCNAGYETSDNLSLSCGESGQWKGSIPMCNPVSCGHPPNIINGYIMTKDHTYGSLLTYGCVPGYNLVSHGKLRCAVDRSWKGDVPSCEPVDCGIPPSIYNGKVDFNQTTYKETAFYFCNNGFDLIGSGMHKCLATGAWSDSSPSCQPVFCGEPRQVINGEVHGKSFHFNQTVTFTCDVGYQLFGHNTSTCTWRREWSNPAPICNMISCLQPTTPENGVVSISDLMYGGRVTYSCMPGYILVGIATRTCREDGSWNGTEAFCKPVDCGSPPDLNNATFNLTGYTLHHQAEYRCIEGHNKAVDIILRCTPNGTWTDLPEGGTCEPIVCVQPPVIQNGFSVDSSYGYNSTILCQCNTGYHLEGSSLLICLETGWVPTEPQVGFPTCLIKSCGFPPSLSNGYSEANSTAYRGVATIFCDDGYELNGVTSISCLETGRWETMSSFCDPITCTALTLHQHGRMQPMKEVYTFMEYISIGCQEGYRLSGSEYIYCVRMNTWNSSTHECTIVSCGNPTRPAMGEVSFHSTSFSSVADYSCYSGYMLTGSSRVQCQADGTWSGNVPTCEAILCRRPNDVPHGYHIPGTYHANDTVEYLCDVGYKLVGRGSRRCTTNGEWSGSLPQCSPVQCPHLSKPLNGLVYYGRTSYLSSAAFSCNVGYILHGRRHAVCQASGHWSNAIPSCEPNTCEAPPTFPSAFIQSVTSSSSSLYTYQTTVTYSCEDGYKMMSNDTISCNADGSWDAITIDCRLQECMLPSVSGELTYSFNSLRHNSQIRFTCPDGFFLNGSSSATCTADGVWDHPFPSCERIKCPSIVRPAHSRVNGDGVFYKDAIKFTCNPGYHLHGAAYINCTISGEWNNAAPICKPMACMKPPDIEFGVPLIDKSYKPNEMILYRCTSGYSLEGMTRRRCQKDGSWTGREPSCKEGRSSHGPAAVKAPPICVVPCLNGGVCTGNYQCLCRYGYSGFRCEIAQCKPRCIGNAKCARRNRQCSE